MSFNKNNLIINQRSEILDFLDGISNDMIEYINNSSNNFVLFYKYLTHSDLPTFGKATKSNDYESNYLYYLTAEEIESNEKIMGKPSLSAHQSNIGLSKKFYEMVDIPDPRSASKKNYLIQDIEESKVYLVNDSLKYFDSVHTKQLFEKLNKTPKNKKERDFDALKLNLSNKFTPLSLHVAVHGIGTKADREFHILRHFMFNGDTFIFLCELGKPRKFFVLTERNPTFFSIIGEINELYKNYLLINRERLISEINSKLNNKKLKAQNKIIKNVNNNLIFDLTQKTTRKFQQRRRTELAKEMMAFSNEPGQVFCPFTYIKINFDTLGSLFVASHIKEFSECEEDEQYDIDNGLLLSSNADALFNQHLITIDENKHLIFSFLLDNNYELRQRLFLQENIFEKILTEKRMKYIEYHRKKFYDLEKQRRSINKQYSKI